MGTVKMVSSESAKSCYQDHMFLFLPISRDGWKPGNMLGAMTHTIFFSFLSFCPALHLAHPAAGLSQLDKASCPPRTINGLYLLAASPLAGSTLEEGDLQFLVFDNCFQLKQNT